MNFLCSYDKKSGASVLRQPDISLPNHIVDILYSRIFLLRLILLEKNPLLLALLVQSLLLIPSSIPQICQYSFSSYLQEQLCLSPGLSQKGSAVHIVGP